jgi:hypothetical protein
MRLLLPVLVAAVVIGSCFLPWMTIESKGLTITGMDTTGTSFGKPAYFHFLWVFLFLLFSLFSKVWSRRAAMVFAAFNIAWAFRNFLVLPICQMGECPIRRTGLYVLLISSLLLFFAGFLGPAKEDVETESPTTNEV